MFQLLLQSGYREANSHHIWTIIINLHTVQVTNTGRKTVVVRASMAENEMPRRAALALAAAAVIGLSVDAAQAVTAAKSASSK